MAQQQQEVVAVVDYRDLSDMPANQPVAAREEAGKRRRRLIGALVIVLLFVAAGIAYYFHTPSGKGAVDTNGSKVRDAMDKELKKLEPYVNVVLLATGLALLLAGRRLYTVAFFVAGLLAGGFLAYTVWTTATADYTGMSASVKMYVAFALSAVCGLLLGVALKRVEKLGTAVVGGCAGFAAGELLYPVTLGQYFTVTWGQYALGGVCALAAFTILLVWERQLLAVTSSAAGAFAAAFGGAQLFFHFDPHNGKTEVTKFWIFIAAVMALFVVGLLVQLKLDPRQPKPELSFYNDDEEEQRQQARYV